eukprot:TRINITY_DN8518_c1_g6_i1.p1 TRINITY_DN8518_c1_g6~~TRINITY_DN8518_c1_g6_i1.p1  ORF type:complete len:647 (-),score=56.87 TRINITY_DN8518_c1_g6_i1:166-2106(-)
MSRKLKTASVAAMLKQVCFETRHREPISVASLSQAMHDRTVNYSLIWVVTDTASIRSLVGKLFASRVSPNAKTVYVDENQIPAGIYFIDRESRHAVHAFLLGSESPRTVDTDLRNFVCQSGELHLSITPLSPAVLMMKSTIRTAVVNVLETRDQSAGDHGGTQPMSIEEAQQFKLGSSFLLPLLEVCERTDASDEMANESLKNILRLLQERGLDDLYEELETEVMMYEVDGYSSTASLPVSTHSESDAPKQQYAEAVLSVEPLTASRSPQLPVQQATKCTDADASLVTGTADVSLFGVIPSILLKADPSVSHFRVSTQRESTPAGPVRNPIEKLCCVWCPEHGFQPARLRPFCTVCKSDAVEVTGTEPTNPMQLLQDVAAECYQCDSETRVRFVPRCSYPRCRHSGTVFAKNVHQFMHADDECLLCAMHHPGELAVYFPCGHVLGFSCFKEFVHVSIGDIRLRKNPQDGVFSLCCPSGCPDAFLQDVLVVKALGQDTWLRFRELQVELMIHDQQWVYCPNCGEAHSVVERSGQGRNVDCVNGKTGFCVNCLRPGSCQAAARETRDPTGHYLLSRRCRNPDCHIVTTHSWGEGCHHITCGCGDDYCYMCGGEFNMDGYECVNGCPLFCEDVEGECVCPRSSSNHCEY